ncbi:MAG: M48 family metalloprotease [Fibrobacteres bacterium]|nr:M48 family metalloprotease [Fibrobacterota bacterium]
MKTLAPDENYILRYVSGKEPNAHALEEGSGIKIIEVTQGLLDKMTDDEIVAVLAHEIAHHQLKHLEKYKQSFWMQLFDGIDNNKAAKWLKEKLENPLALQIVLNCLKLPLTPLLMHLSRKHETEADSRAVEILALDEKLFKPEAILSVEQKLKVLSLPAYRTFLDRLLASHPHPSERIKTIEKGIREAIARTKSTFYLRLKSILAPHPHKSISLA